MKKLWLWLVAMFVAMGMYGQVVFEEDFEDCSSMGPVPAGWTVYEDTLTVVDDFAAWGNGWMVYEEGTLGKVAVSISETIQGDEDSALMCDRWLVTPKIAVNSVDMKLTFSVAGNISGYAERLKVMVSTLTTDTEDFGELVLLEDIMSDEEVVTVDLDEYVGEEVYIAFVNCGNGVYVTLDDVRVGAEMSPVMELCEVRIPYYLKRGEDTVIGGTIRNKGMEAIRSFDAYYMVNGMLSEVTHIEGIDVGYGERYGFVVEDSLRGGSIGIKNVELRVANVNGEAIGAGGMRSGEDLMVVWDDGHKYDRRMAVENFVAETCENGLEIEQMIGRAVEGKDVVRVTYHAGCGEDGMTVDEDVDLLDFYNDSVGGYELGMMLDRSQWNYENSGVVLFAGMDAEIGAYVEQAMNMPAIANVEVLEADYGMNEGKLSVTVRGSMFEEYVARNLRLMVYLVEDSVLGSDGRWYMNVMRDGITDVWGELLADGMFVKQYEYDVLEEYDMSHCRVVAMVGLYDEDVNRRRVLNATECGVRVDVTEEGIEMADRVRVRMYPNPVSKWLKIESEEMIRGVKVVNMQGVQVYGNEVLGKEMMIDVEDWIAGVYEVMVITQRGVNKERVIIVK